MPDHDTTSPPDSELQLAPPGWGYRAIIALFLLVAIAFGVHSCNQKIEKAQEERAAASAYAAAHPPTAPIMRVGQTRTAYSFADSDGIIRIRVHVGEVDFYPQGGGIEICPPPPAKCWRDHPGHRLPRKKLPSGEYIITRIDPHATGIEVWN